MNKQNINEGYFQKYASNVTFENQFRMLPQSRKLQFWNAATCGTSKREILCFTLLNQDANAELKSY